MRARLAAFALILVAPASAMAGGLDDSFLRGSYSRWDGINFGAQVGLSNLNTDFSGSTSSEVAYILRNTTLENEARPSDWASLPSSTTNGQNYGAFLGYSVQWDQLVVGFDVAYNRMSTMQSSASDSIGRVVTTSDNVTHDLFIASQASIKLIDYATVRARAGYSFGQFLPYAFIGGAVGRFNYSKSATVTDVWTAAGSNTSTTFGPITKGEAKDNAIVGGFTTGLGMDVAILPNVFLRSEWEFTAFAPVGGIKTTLNSGRVGIGARF